MLHNYIGTEHILLGLMREEKSVAAGILAEKGMRLSAVREDIVQLLNEKANVGKTKETPLLSEFSRDLTEAAARGSARPAGRAARTSWPASSRCSAAAPATTPC